eukprot:GHVN01106751.1.p1 GENE.GHVN01106751.1~~GHVN01106751.1.p1  ORF type:complete len:444 (+),score=57.72 GHVN01106751.1:146-1477(+)
MGQVASTEGTGTGNGAVPVQDVNGDGTQRYFGLPNLGNTCYCNTVLQVLYHSEPFRKNCLKFKPDGGDSMLGALGEVFKQLKLSRGNRTAAVRKFVDKLRKENAMFASAEHHDAHELFNFLVNDIADTLLKNRIVPPEQGSVCGSAATAHPDAKTWVHHMLEGNLVCETRCRRCDNVTKREEPFLDLSVDIQHNSTLKTCIENFGAMEVLNRNEKYFCDECGNLEEAERKLRIGRLPHVLTVHLKRFKFDEATQRYQRLGDNVQFPVDLTLTCFPCNSQWNVKVQYTLAAVIVHIGQGIQHGHYVCCVNTNDAWRIFDDQKVQVVGPEILQNFYQGTKCGYLLLYNEVVDPAEVDRNNSLSPISGSPTQAPPPRHQKELFRRQKSTPVSQERSSTPSPGIGGRLSPPAQASTSIPTPSRQPPKSAKSPRALFRRGKTADLPTG